MSWNRFGHAPALLLAAGMLVGCSAENKDEGPPVPVPTIEMPEQPSQVFSTETPAKKPEQPAAAKPAGEGSGKKSAPQKP